MAKKQGLGIGGVREGGGTHAPCTFEPHGEGFTLAFDAPQWAVTPGQSAVLYDGEVCLGGGVIARATTPALDAAVAVPAGTAAPATGRSPA